MDQKTRSRPRERKKVAKLLGTSGRGKMVKVETGTEGGRKRETEGRWRRGHREVFFSCVVSFCFVAPLFEAFSQVWLSLVVEWLDLFVPVLRADCCGGAGVL